MAKGRNRKSRPREKNGRAQRPDVQENMLETMRPALEARCRVMGWHIRDWMDARDTRLATLQGRLFVAKSLTEREYLALDAYATLLHQWQRAIEAPPPHPKCSTLETEPARVADVADVAEVATLESWEDRVKRISAAFMAAEGVLLGTGRKDVVLEVLTAPETTAPHEVSLQMLARIKFAARRLAKHFRIDG